MREVYISKNALLEEYDKHHVGPPGGARKLIEEAPGVDLVKVVRCKDCYFFGKDKEFAREKGLIEEYYCSILEDEMNPRAFCSYGREEPWSD